MTKIPADIENAAIELCEAHVDWPTSQIVMKAILQERLRCSEKAMHWAEKLAEAAEQSEDKIDGLQADLDSAVEVAFRRGATDWVLLNHPNHFARLSAPPPAMQEAMEKEE